MAKGQSAYVVEKTPKPAGKLAQWAAAEKFYGRLPKPPRARVLRHAACLWAQERRRALLAWFTGVAVAAGAWYVGQLARRLTPRPRR